MAGYHDVLLEELEKDLEYYDRIFLIPAVSQEYLDLFIQFGDSDKLENCRKKILVLSDENLAEGKRFSCRKLPRQTVRRLRELYFMYEFSDRFQLLSQEESFGGILNFVDAGILTKEEAICALFH